MNGRLPSDQPTSAVKVIRNYCESLKLRVWIFGTMHAYYVMKSRGKGIACRVVFQFLWSLSLSKALGILYGTSIYPSQCRSYLQSV